MQTITAPGPLGFDVAHGEPATPPRGFAQGAALSNLRQLVMLRNVAVAAQALTILVVHHGLGIALPVVPMLVAVAALAAFNAATWYRLWRVRRATDRELMGQLLVDVFVLTLLLAMAGGATNPFVGMFLLPLAITAACLPWTYTWLVALVTIACHSLLVSVFRPLFAPGDEAKFLQLLVSGMWVNYAITAGMIAHFVVRMAAGRRRSDRLLATHRERDMCSEHLVRIGTLAAGAAHELAQPLATLSVVADELREHCEGDPGVQPLLRDLRLQLDNCQDTLRTLLSYGRQTLASETCWLPLDDFARDCVDAFRVRRPTAKVHLRIATADAAPIVRHDQALRQGLLNLLGNAADVSEHWIELELRWDAEFIVLSVRDRGPGIAPEAQGQIGRLFFTTKPSGAGNGLGLCLAQTAAERLGGWLQLTNGVDGGACARVTLPLRSMTQAPTARPHD